MSATPIPASGDAKVAARVLREAAASARAALGDAVSGHCLISDVRRWLDSLARRYEQEEDLSAHEAEVASSTLRDAAKGASAALSSGGGWTSTYSVRGWLNGLADNTLDHEGAIA